MPITAEFRIAMPMSLEEYKTGLLWSTSQTSLNETGGGEGVEVIANEPRNHEEYGSCQYTNKVLHISSKLPSVMRKLAPTGSLELREESWNCFPFTHTKLTNAYMKENFYIIIDTWYKEGLPDMDNVHKMTDEELKDRQVHNIDIANDPIDETDPKEDEDPAKVRSEKTGRGPLQADWIKTSAPVITAYKKVSVLFKWFGMQDSMEQRIMKFYKRTFTRFNRQVFCWMDQWHGLSLADVRQFEEKTRHEFNTARNSGEARGMAVRM